MLLRGEAATSNAPFASVKDGQVAHTPSASFLKGSIHTPDKRENDTGRQESVCSGCKNISPASSSHSSTASLAGPLFKLPGETSDPPAEVPHANRRGSGAVPPAAVLTRVSGKPDTQRCSRQAAGETPCRAEGTANTVTV